MEGRLKDLNVVLKFLHLCEFFKLQAFMQARFIESIHTIQYNIDRLIVFKDHFITDQTDMKLNKGLRCLD